MEICGACEEELPRESFSGKQWRLRKSLRRCGECVAAGNELVLFTQGRERPADDECPICSRLFPIASWDSYYDETLLYRCCMKIVCCGCELARQKKGGMGDNCPFCRTPPPESDEEMFEMIKKRVKSVDPKAIHDFGVCYLYGHFGMEKDVPRSVELFERAAGLGLNEAHYSLATMFDKYDKYADVEGILDKDMARAVEHYEVAAKQGHVIARSCLGRIDYNAGNTGLALKHWMISANLGDGDSLDAIKKMYMDGLAMKADYGEALRGYHDAVKEMSSPEREEANALQRTRS